MLTKSFITAGRASFVVGNPSGESVTIKITKAKSRFDAQGHPRAAKFWVNVRHNNDPWEWVGSLDINAGQIVEVRSPTYRYTDPRTLKIANWALDCIWKGSVLPAGYRVEHTGKCGRCGKMLRDADSITSGFGPECRKYI